MIQYHYKRDFLKAFDKLKDAERRLAVVADEEIRRYCATGQAVYGLRVKKLYESAVGQIFEARVSRSLRILWTRHGHDVHFTVLGGHDEVRRYLKNL